MAENAFYKKLGINQEFYSQTEKSQTYAENLVENENFVDTDSRLYRNKSLEAQNSKLTKGKEKI